jgi:predicted DNA-binding transcriptional regulator YafY
MSPGDQPAREWRIIQTIISSKHGKTVAGLVQDENCHPKTIYRDLIKFFRGTAFHDAFESLFRKVKITLPRESLAYLEQAEQIVFVGIKPCEDYRRFRENIHRIDEAEVKRKTVDMGYRAASRREEQTRRQVDPYPILLCDGTLRLAIHDRPVKVTNRLDQEAAGQSKENKGAGTEGDGCCGKDSDC